MRAKQTFLNAIWTDNWKESYVGLDRRTANGHAMTRRLPLIKQEFTHGLRVKPIQPEKYYFEARISSGDRIIFRVEGGTIYFIDVVKHDDIGRYGRRPRAR